MNRIAKTITVVGQQHPAAKTPLTAEAETSIVEEILAAAGLESIRRA